MNHFEPMLKPQERLDRLISATFRRFGPKTVDLSYANPHEGPDEVVRAAVERAAAEATSLELQYGPYGGRTLPRRLIAGKLARIYGLPLEYRDIVMTAGATAALNVVFRTLFGPGEEIIVLTPCWLDYPLYLRNLNIRIRTVALGPDKHFDLDAIRRALNPSTKAILFSQPSCPTGVLYSKDEIVALSKLLRHAEERFGTSIYAISDEVHRQLVWSGASFHSVLLNHPRSLSIYSFGKTLALQGERIGYVAVSPEMPERNTFRQALERTMRIMGFGAPSSVMQRAICDLLDYSPRLELLAQKQVGVRAALSGYGFDVCRGDGTFFVYVRCPIADDFEFAESLATNGVLVAPSTLFHEQGYIRLSLTERSESIAAGLPAFEAALKNSAERHECLTQS